MTTELKSPLQVLKATTRTELLKPCRSLSPAGKKTVENTKTKNESRRNLGKTSQIDPCLAQKEPELIQSEQVKVIKTLNGSYSPYLRNVDDPTLVPLYPVIIDENFTSEPYDSALDFDSDESIDIMNLMYK